MIVRTQESAQEPSGSWRPCSLPRSHPGHRQEYIPHPTVPGSPLRAVRGAGKRPVRSPRFSVVLSDGARDPPRRMLSRHFPVALVCYGGDRRRGRSQTATLALGASVTAPALGPVIPHLSCTRRRTSWAGLSGAACSVSDTRSKPLNQQD